MPSIPQVPPAGLNAQMNLAEILAAAKTSDRYFHDTDVHLLTDWLERVGTHYRGLLARLEWQGGQGFECERCCPVCAADPEYDKTHAANCWLAVELRG